MKGCGSDIMLICVWVCCLGSGLRLCPVAQEGIDWNNSIARAF